MDWLEDGLNKKTKKDTTAKKSQNYVIYKDVIGRIEAILSKWNAQLSRIAKEAIFVEVALTSQDIKDKFFQIELLRKYCKAYTGSDKAFNWINSYLYPEDEAESPIRYEKDLYKITYRGVHGSIAITEDYLIYVNYRLVDEEENVRWILELKRRSDSHTLEISNQDFSSAKKIKEIFLSKLYPIIISDNQLSHLHAHLIKMNPVDAKKVTRYGYDADADAFIFANGAIYKQKFYQQNENGIIELGQKAISMPIFEREKAEKHWFRFIVPSEAIPANAWWIHFSAAHTTRVALPVFCHYIFSIYRDIIVDLLGASPILFLKGPAGSGKSAIARNILTLFGVPPRDANLNLASTVRAVALARTLSQYSNFPLWVDEYKTDHPIEGSLQAAYDNAGVVKAKQRGGDYNTGNETETTEIRSSIMMTTNYFPSKEPFFSRCIYVSVAKQKRTEEQERNFEIIHRYEEQGLSYITAQFQKHRELIKKQIHATYKKTYRTIKKNIKAEGVLDRLIINQAIIIAPAIIVNKEEGILQNTLGDNWEERIIYYAVEQITNQHLAMGESSHIRIFFEVLYRMKCDQKLFLDKEYRFKLDRDQRFYLIIKFSNIWPKYKDYYQRTYHTPSPDRKTIEDEIAKFLDKENQSIYSQESMRPFTMKADDFTDTKGSMVGYKDCVKIPYDKIIDSFGINFLEEDHEAARQSHKDSY